MMKGNMWIWLSVTFLVFIEGFVWIIMSEVYVPHIFPQSETIMAGHVEALQTLSFIETVWNNWPVLTIIFTVIVGFIASQKMEGRSESY